MLEFSGLSCICFRSFWGLIWRIFEFAVKTKFYFHYNVAFIDISFNP
ncbi:hypothetical protein PULV_a0820 [Pseudoalteromonas ulvae UL12]|nr:hypothetical protein [Pseudoalteromonas ulvae UL12]